MDKAGAYEEYKGEFRTIEYPAEEREERTRRRAKRAGVNFKINKRLVDTETATDVLSVIERDLSSFNFVNLITCMYRLAIVSQALTPLHRAHVRQDARLKAVLRELADTLTIDAEMTTVQQSILSPKEVSNLVWSATKLGIADHALFEAFAKTAMTHMAAYDSVNVSVTLWGFAKMEQVHVGLLEAARSRVLSLLPAFEPHRLCNTVWGFAKMNKASPAGQEFFVALAEQAHSKWTQFNASNQSMMLYSLALAHCYYKPLYDRFLHQLDKVIASEDLADPRGLSNLVWTLVQVDKYSEHTAVVKTVICSAISNINRYSLTHLATLLGSLVRAGVTQGDSADIDLLFTKAYDQTLAKYSPDAPFEQAITSDEMEILRGAFSRFKFPPIFPELPKLVATTKGANCASESGAPETKKQFSLLFDTLGTAFIGVVLMILLELVRAAWK